ncbi:MAG: xanthine dehydrogenase family protein, partial [Acetobacteraceae bacterium]|nr:xanthine dehydrogenase family protein [Acetobacteraceae bacterium]
MMDGGCPSFRAPVIALDGPAKVTGAARYTFDISIPGMLHAKVLRSSHPHARIRSIDTSRAEELPGVAAIVTGADAVALPDPYYGVAIRDQPLIAIDKVRYIGDMVAAVAAVDEETAYRALALIDVDYELLAPVTSIEDALTEGAPILFDAPVGGAATPVGDAAVSLKEPRPNILHEFGYRNGDAEAVLAAADHVFEDRFVFSRINHFHLEPYVNVAQADCDGIELWSCNQDPFVLRNDIARIFGRPANTVRIHSSFVGGGFGGKSFCKMEPLVVLLALKAARPVRLCLSMDEALLTLTKHAAILVLKTGVMADGRLTARQSEIFLDAGAYSDASVTTTIKTGYRITGPYRWDAVASRAYAVRTTMVPAGSFRGFGGTQASFASESQIDMIARRLGFDPVEFRRKNLLTREEPFQPGDTPIDSDLPTVLDDVAARIGYYERPTPRSSIKKRGWGVAIGLKDGGGTGNHSLALVKVLPTGRAIVHAATVEIGQGATTALCRIAAEVLGLPLDWVRYGEIDTEHTPLNNGTHVSCATAVTGLAVERAAADARRQVMEFAAKQIDCRPDQLVLENWSVRRGNYAHRLDQLIGDYYGGAGTEFIGRGSTKIDFDPEAPIASHSMFWMPCWVGAEVEVDTGTGKVEVTRLVAAADAGTSINAVACRGQVEGAVLQAYGQSLFEELRYDGANSVNATPLSYRVPLATDVPKHYEGFVVEHGGPGPFGAKGIGE